MKLKQLPFFFAIFYSLLPFSLYLFLGVSVSYVSFFSSFLFLFLLLLSPLKLIPARGYRHAAYFLINTCATATCAAMMLTREMPTNATLHALMATSWHESGEIVRASLLPLSFLAIAWLVQTIILCFSKTPTFLNNLMNTRWRLLVFALPAWLVIAVPSLKTEYPISVVKLFTVMIDQVFFSPPKIVTPVPKLIRLTNDKVPEAELMVLFIGESSQFEYWQLNNEKEQTTPFLSSRRVKKELVVFPLHFSAAAATELAVPNLLTPFGTLITSNKRQNPSLVSLMKKAGKKTAWLSTQAPTLASDEASFRDSAITDSFSDYYIEKNYDEKLVDKLDNWLTQHPSQDSFIALHSLGSHIPFEKRYPTRFTKWEVATKTYPLSQTENNYRNTILYTDYVIENTLKRLEKENRPALFVYVSDHGESAMRGLQRSSKKITTETLHVPFFIWANNAWRSKHVDNWSALTQRALSNIRTHHLDIAPTLLHLSGFRFEGSPEIHNLLSPYYTENPTPPYFNLNTQSIAYAPALKK